MKNFLYLLIVFLIAGMDVLAQKDDSIKIYLSHNLSFTTKRNAVYLAMAIRSQDHWLLYGVYPDTTPLVKMYFADKDLKVKDGPYTLYHPKRVKAVEGYYEQNASKGVWRYYYPNGQIRDSGMLINDRLTGLWRSWDEQGNLAAEINYDSSALKQRTLGTIPGSGSILPASAASGITKMMHGECRIYFPNGKMQEYAVYENDRKTGPWKKWYENGVQESIGYFQKDSMTGDWQFYRENGKLSTKEKYKGNKVVAMECFDENGNATGSNCSILKPPVAQGNFLNFNEYMLDNVFWPKKLGRDVQGAVKVKFTVTREGKMKDFRIVSSPHELLSKEVERFFGTISSWSPAISHNRVIEYTMEYEVPFYRN
jgi:antitoxin component YwqK of YwqJK toxin-antitoxin module